MNDGVPDNGAGDRRDEFGPPPSRGTKLAYFVMMGTCIALISIAWTVVDSYSTIAAVIMSLAALIIPPFAAIVANRASAVDRRRP